MKSFFVRLLCAFGTALILMFFSEYLFVNESPSLALISTIKANPWAVIPAYIEFGLYYTLFTYPFLFIMSLYNVRTISGLFWLADRSRYHSHGL